MRQLTNYAFVCADFKRFGWRRVRRIVALNSKNTFVELKGNHLFQVLKSNRLSNIPRSGLPR